MWYITPSALVLLFSDGPCEVNMAWWNKSKRVEQPAPHEQGLKSILNAELSKEQSEQYASAKKSHQERLAKEEAKRQADLQYSMSQLKAQLFYCFGVKASPTTNPTQVDGLWIGFNKYDVNGDGHGNDRRGDPYREKHWSHEGMNPPASDIAWAISLYVSCRNCGHLRVGRIFTYTNWDMIKATCQERLVDEKAKGSVMGRPMTPNTWEDIYAFFGVRNFYTKKNDERFGRHKGKPYWELGLQEYRTAKTREFAHYLKDYENDFKYGNGTDMKCLRYYGPCPSCEVK